MDEQTDGNLHALVTHAKAGATKRGTHEDVWHQIKSVVH